MSIIKDIKRDSKKYYGLPFWSWNDKLQKDRLFEQIHNMKANNYGGFFMHARGGLKTDYFSDEWFALIKSCVDKANKLGLEAWAYDENGWPSGFANGKLLNDNENLASFLTYRKGCFDKNAFAVYDSDGKRTDSTNKSNDLINIYKDYSHDYVDLMNPSVVDKFLDIVYNEYKNRFGGVLNNKLAGFFTDEPQYYRYHTPWSDIFPKVFKDRFGYDVYDVLPALFVDFRGAKELRYDYHLLCHELYINSFAKKVYTWCNENQVKLTGHTIEETTLNMQMWCCGGAMPFYEYEHIPGIDHLTKCINTDLCTKQIGSVAAQLGKDRVLSETFAACGWDVSPLVLKRNVEWQFASGINTICHHLYSYSERGERKYDHPLHFSEHLPWFNYMKDFNAYFANLAAAMSKGEENANVLVLHPIRTAYLYYKREEDNLDFLEKPFDMLLEKLGQDNIQYHFGDETLIKKYGSVEGKRLVVGKCSYDFVIVPKVETIDLSTAILLDKYIENGGGILFVDKPPFRVDGHISKRYRFISNIRYDDILKSREAYIENSNVRMNIRNSKYGRLFYIANVTHNEFEDAMLVINNCKGIYRIDLKTLEKQPVEYNKICNNIQVQLHIKDSDDYLFVESNDISQKSNIKKEIIKTYYNSKPFLSKRPENCLVVDFAEFSKDGKNFEPIRYIKNIHELLIKEKYEGRAYLRFIFNSDYISNKFLICCEPLKNLEVYVNSKKADKINGYRIDKSFLLFNSSDFIFKGKNEVTLSFDYFQSQKVYDVMFSEAMENKRNSLALDTELEPIYLFGDFYVSGKFRRGKQSCSLSNGKFRICPPKNNIKIKNVVTDGYPFFFGGIKVVYHFEAQYDGIYELEAIGKYDVCNVFVNGKFSDYLMFSNVCKINLKQGKNEIELEIINSMRNTFGPLHHVDDECLLTSPLEFTFEGEWERNKTPTNFNERYSFMRFGIDKIKISKVSFE